MLSIQERLVTYFAITHSIPSFTVSSNFNFNLYDTEAYCKTCSTNMANEEEVKLFEAFIKKFGANGVNLKKFYKMVRGEWDNWFLCTTKSPQEEETGLMNSTAVVGKCSRVKPWALWEVALVWYFERYLSCTLATFVPYLDDRTYGAAIQMLYKVRKYMKKSSNCTKFATQEIYDEVIVILNTTLNYGNPIECLELYSKKHKELLEVQGVELKKPETVKPSAQPTEAPKTTLVPTDIKIEHVFITYKEKGGKKKSAHFKHEDTVEAFAFIKHLKDRNLQFNIFGCVPVNMDVEIKFRIR